VIKILGDMFVDPHPGLQSDDPLVEAHRHCASHRQEVLASEQCGCFSCQAVFQPDEISEWIEETGGELAKRPDPWTAICPTCGLDAVVGSASGFPVADQKFLKAMNARWFGSIEGIDE
jgi:hypothetical protein